MYLWRVAADLMPGLVHAFGAQQPNLASTLEVHEIVRTHCRAVDIEKIVFGKLTGSRETGFPFFTA